MGGSVQANHVQGNAGVFGASLGRDKDRDVNEQPPAASPAEAQVDLREL